VGPSLATRWPPTRCSGRRSRRTPRASPAGEFEVKIGNYGMPVYEARPASGSGHPIILVISEIWGCTSTFVTRRGASPRRGTTRSPPSCSSEKAASPTFRTSRTSSRSYSVSLAHPGERGLGDLSGPLLAEPLNQRPRPRHALGGHHQLLGERNPERARGVDAKLGGHAALVGAGIE
jgi:hypothetical protein